MRKIAIFTVGFIFIIGISLNAQVNGSTPSTLPVHNFSEKGQTLDVVHRLSAEYRVVIGIYGYDSDTQEPIIDISIKNGTVGDVFDAITKADPRFEWRQQNGAIHFVIKDSPILLLDVTPHSFEVSNPQTSDILDLLHGVPEIHSWLQTHKCAMDFIIFNDGPRPVPWRRFTIRTTDLPLSSILDLIAAKSGTYAWSLIEYKKQPCKMNIGWGQVEAKEK